ncbi:flagellar hook-associated protein 2 [Alteribacillus sp. YIM 98480]|uniref:flagellar hook-associated protein 2 n=1 Tax=Alteribacillus sp. YIM 98480 TaxID=2606599 RepID=UPI00131DDE33|nr:flagellar hook-associated protein 2 [Alteribacillus sp. YIM 98480]
MQVDNRVTGFASGMDINQQVQDLMRVERQPLVKMEQDALRLQYEMEDYREMNREYQSFSDSIFDGIIRRSNTTAKEAISSNENLVEASASADANEGSYTISNITQLASAATNQSKDTNGDPVEVTDDNGERLDPDESLWDQLQNTINWDTADGENSEFSFNMTMYNEDGAHTEEFTFSGTDTLNDVLDGINNSNAGVNAYYDDFSGQVAITRSETGNFNQSGSEMEFSENFLGNVLSLHSENETGGENAIFEMNGIETERTSNTFEEDNVQFTLNNTTTGDESASINVSADTESIKETIMGFVEDYNEMIEKTDEKLSEEYYRDYPPLTEEQRSEMNETEIEQWEERSQSGYLRRDSILTNGLDTMRQDMYAEVDTGDGAAFSHLTEIGITTSSDYRERGKLEVDETELEQAIQEDSEAVYQLFSADGESYEEKGVARRVRESLDHTMDSISERAGGPAMPSPDQFTIGREMNNLDDRMSNFERRMQKTEERYWDQFTRMEQAMAEANAQAQQMQQQMAGMGGGMM